MLYSSMFCWLSELDRLSSFEGLRRFRSESGVVSLAVLELATATCVELCGVSGSGCAGLLARLDSAGTIFVAVVAVDGDEEHVELEVPDCGSWLYTSYSLMLPDIS